MQDTETRLAVLEEQRRAHEKHCDEREARVERDIGRITTTMEREAGERLAGLARVHSRIDEVGTTIATMGTTLDGVPEMVRNAVKSAAQGMRLWVALQALGVTGFLIAFLVEHYVVKGH